MKYVHYRELTSVGVKVNPSHGGYYLFPDFDICREKLNQIGVKNGQEMCDLILKEFKVAVSYVN